MNVPAGQPRPLSPVQSVFDIRESREKVRRSRRFVRTMSQVILVLFSGMLAWFFWLGLSPGGLAYPFQRLAFTVVVVGFSSCIGQLGWGLFRWREGPSFFAMTEDGVTLVWESGRRRTIRWDDLPRGFRLTNLEKEFGIQQDVWFFDRWDIPVTCIPEPAVDELLKAGIERGIRTIERRFGVSMFRWFPYTSYHFAA